ncbi:YdcF family protein [Microlunatus soli]|uniref:Uncharacterized SAM-binding protein YcdF, DUF218 family n=1 Tax=Microlunatus soli TaxID=630515 RepID=A0A1H1XMF4_9ACTN|nr:YdcF family protein [Microlunatus soli]SDT10404.1 Uncharacterized SAM-binding protein YcdF, DUF218 family [Microlunatus soli]
MLTGLLTALVIIVPVAIAFGVCWMAVRRIRTEPRRWSNAYWLLAAILLLVQTFAGLGLPGAGLVVWLLGMVMLTGPLLVLVLTVFLILNGAVMLRRESRSLGNLLSLIAGVGLLALLVIIIPVLLTRSVWLILALVAVLLIATYLGFQFVAFAGYALLYPRLIRDRPAEWIVVLGSGLGRDGRVTPLLASRIRTGIEQYRRRGASLLIMSGGQGEDEIRPEAEAMAEWALGNGADPDAVRQEARSRNTEQNLRFSRELLPSGGVDADLEPTDPTRRAEQPTTSPGLIVTSNYHVMRAAILARKLGIPAQATGAPTAGYYWPSAMIREFVAVLAERPRLHVLAAALVALPVPLLFAVVHLIS